MRPLPVHVSSATLRRAAWAIPAVYAVVAPAALALAIANGSLLDDDKSLVAAFALYSLVGALIASRQPTNPIGWLLGAAALSAAVAFLSYQYAVFGVVTAPGALPLAGIAAWLSIWVWMGMLAPLVFTVMLFPAGRLPSPRWRPMAWIAGSFLGVVAVIFAFGTPSIDADRHPQVANPLWIPALTPLQQLADASFVLFLLLFGLAVAALVFRFRGSRGVERQQLKWIVAAGLVMVLSIFLSVFEAAFDWAWVVTIVALPVSIGIAILRHRLYDIDVLINRALVYGALTATLGAAYVGSVLLLQAMLRPFTADNEIAVAGSTLAVAALFGPLRGRIQRLVDRRFYRSRYDAARTLDAFAERLRDEVDLDQLRTELVGVVAQTMRPKHASVWLRGGRP
ncbi:MAG: hypothetical protein ACRDGE_12010 [Candidatus Limnocylindria bacterium]